MKQVWNSDNFFLGIFFLDGVKRVKCSRRDNLLSEFANIPDPVLFGKHRNCYASYTNLRDVKTEIKDTQEKRPSIRRPSYGR